MTRALAFWVLMLVALVLGGIGSSTLWTQNRWAFGNNVLLYVLLVLLGWQVFNAPIH